MDDKLLIDKAKVFADENIALDYSKALFPDASNFFLINHGYDNVVILVDANYAIRFPRNKNAYLRSLYERQLLNKLKDVTAVAIPNIISTHHEPECMVTSFVPGRHISSQAVNELPTELQLNFANKVAEFVFVLHSKLSIKEAKIARKKLKLDELLEEPWDIYFKKTIYSHKLPTLTQDKLAKWQYKQWLRAKHSSELVVIHDDLHTENMLFNENNELVGVLDFGDTNIGSPEQELRSLYRINEFFLVAAVKMYEKLSSQQLNIEYAKYWAILQEIAAYSSHINDQSTSHPSFSRACRNLNKWLPDGKWGDGIQIMSGGTIQ